MSDLPTTTLGRTGLTVARLGFGAMVLRGKREGFGPEVVGRLLGSVLDAGINVIDTSPDYGTSEERIGEHLAHRRDEYVLASKCGCPVDVPTPPEGGQPPHVYRPDNVRAAVEQSLRRMRTDHLDILQLHGNPSRSVLERDDTIATLLDLRHEGKARFIGSSTHFPHVTDHLAMQVFDVVQLPYSALEREHEEVLANAASDDVGVVVRGAVAQGVTTRTAGQITAMKDAERARAEKRLARWDRAQVDDLRGDISRNELMLRFVLSNPDAHVSIVGTGDVEHLAANVTAAAKGPLPRELYEELERRIDGAPRSQLDGDADPTNGAREPAWPRWRSRLSRRVRILKG